MIRALSFSLTLTYAVVELESWEVETVILIDASIVEHDLLMQRGGGLLQLTLELRLDNLHLLFALFHMFVCSGLHSIGKMTCSNRIESYRIKSAKRERERERENRDLARTW